MKDEILKEIPISLDKIINVIRETNSKEEAKNLLESRYGIPGELSLRIFNSRFEDIKNAKVIRISN